MFAYGIATFEKIEKHVDKSTLDNMKNSLNTLVKIRNSHAHTFIHGATASFHAPSITMNHFVNVFDGLKEFELQIKKFT
jgi:hypothetical protein